MAKEKKKKSNTKILKYYYLDIQYQMINNNWLNT